MSAKILVIEDEERIQQFLNRGLAYEGYRVEVASDGLEGLEMARSGAADRSLFCSPMKLRSSAIASILVTFRLVEGNYYNWA